MSNFNLPEETNFEPIVVDYKVDCSSEVGRDVVTYFIGKISDRNNIAMLTIKCSDGFEYRERFNIKEWENYK